MQAPSGWLHERQHSEDNGCQSKDNEEDLFSSKTVFRPNFNK